MSIRLKFVKGAFLSTYTNTTTGQVPQHIIQVDQLLRIKSKTKPPATPQPEFDLKAADLSAVRRVHVSAPSGAGGFPPCINDNTTLSAIVNDRTVTAAANLINVEVVGGTFSYPHSTVACPSFPGQNKAFGWIQVDFLTGPVTVQLFDGAGNLLSTKTVFDGQYFDVTGYIMYVNEAGALEAEPPSPGFVVAEQSDGSATPPPT